jgi:nucleoside-diphosphate-sugar epimerase
MQKKNSTRVLITGGSGFIGTNLMDYYISKKCNVLNIDIVSPRNPQHFAYWHQADICDIAALSEVVKAFDPNYILHMAAKTDLNGSVLDDYQANTVGVKSLIKAAQSAPSLKRVIFASSMLVCRLGYHPDTDEDFCPTTLYGKSKVIGEKLVSSPIAEHIDWIIVRPTSLWGPWFGVPYSHFFDAVAKCRYFHPKGKRIRRSYGFVLNMVEYLDRLLFCHKRQLSNNKVFYLADYEPIELFDWATEISKVFGVSPPKEVPLSVLKGLAKIGDRLKAVGVNDPPLTSFRLNNLLTEAIFDMTRLAKVAGPMKYSFNEAVHLTVTWMQERHNISELREG